MKAKSYGAELWTDFPRDDVREGNEIVQYGGRNVATAIAELLTKLGYQVEGPENGDEHGWWLYLNQGGRQFFVQVTDLRPDIILLVDDVTFFVNRWWYRKEARLFGELVDKLKTALEADPRFHHIRWFERDSRGREIGPDRKPLPSVQMQAQALARHAEARALGRI